MFCPETEEDQDLDEFQDASSEMPVLPEGMTLDKGIEEAQKAINYFFNNKFKEAIELMEPWANVSMYHSIGYSVFCFNQAILTFDHDHIVSAGKALKESLIVCNRYRKKQTIGKSFGKIVKKTNYDSYTDEEVHAELCHAECLLLKATLTLIEDETLSSFIKAGLKIRSCFNSYKECQQILLSKNWDSSTNKEHFESGVLTGIGAFNLMISMLPTRVIKLLEFIGFSGDKELGLEALHKGYNMEGIRQILCLMTLLGYHLIVRYVLSHQEGDLEICDKILQEQLKKYPDGCWFLFFKGRYEFMKCNLDASIEWYEKSWKSQNVWPQFHQLCFWELLWVNCVKGDWKRACLFSTYLVDEGKWSRTIYHYQKAAIMLMMDDKSSDDIQTIENLMRDVPKYKQRIAGKSIPMEKFAVKKSERFFNQNNSLVLPVIELIFLWNLFKLLKKQFSVADRIFRLCEKAQKELDGSTVKGKYYKDNLALVYLLKGACLRQMGSPLQALECLESAISLQKEINEDHYIVPYAIVELAFTEWENGNKEKAILALEDAKKNYSGYSLESRLHFKIHTALTEYKAEMKRN